MQKLFWLLLTLVVQQAGAQYKQAPVNLATEWGIKVNPKNAWQEYPRPQMVRSQWQNLNGLWNYAISKKGAAQPSAFNSKILVPYPIESSLSGVGKSLLPDQELWYQTKFSIPRSWNGNDIILRFDAVDWKTIVWINGQKAGEHKGGSDPFSFNITPYLKTSGNNELVVSVWDPTDTDYQARGKQVLDPKGIWYTAVSGIWQTVWLEPVAKTAITTFNPVADIDNNRVNFNIAGQGDISKTVVNLNISHKGKSVKEITVPYHHTISVDIPNPRLWEPGSPEIYDTEVKLLRDGKVLDAFKTYFAMRKVNLVKDADGYVRLGLNNKPIFHYGTLDQGWWPDGLLTPPSDAAMLYDMVKLKEMGFNTIRKHIKVEPARFYFHADTMGILLWQDMPSGFKWPNHPSHVDAYATEDWVRPVESARQFEAEWKSIIDHLRFFSSIVMWVPLNEGWGQYDTKRLNDWTKNYDSTRLVNTPSGWTDRGVGDVLDAHQYPGPGMYDLSQSKGRSLVLGEFGGLGLVIKNHIWNPNKRNWGYKTYTEDAILIREYTELMHNMHLMIPRGLAAAIYTQTTDVEGEVNGLMTYDRKVIKIPVKLLKQLHEPLYTKPAGKITYINQKSESNRPTFSYNAAATNNWMTLTGSTAFYKTKIPVKVEKGQNMYAYQDINLTNIPKGLGIKLYASGDARIYINGNMVWKEDQVRIKRHYDDINLSDGIKFLKTGTNRIAVETINASQDVNFDFSLYRLD